jgi:hypothetical protein
MPPPGGHHHARSLPPNGPSDPFAGAGDRASVLIAPGLEAVTRRAQREGSGRRPVARAYRSGGAMHTFEGALSPDRVPELTTDLAGAEHHVRVHDAFRVRK